MEVQYRRGTVEMMDFEMRSQKPLKEIVYLELKHKILTGEIPAGSRLMEVDLAKRMNVSRTPIREAIRRLNDDGLVQMEARKGAYVAQISIKDMLDVFEIREDMEGFCAYLAAGRSSNERIPRRTNAGGFQSIDKVDDLKAFKKRLQGEKLPMREFA